ncbi:MAG: ABC transporter ATP-binding protein, partial [Eggerthellaceae bacterium]|nr:ABC transporter ATP-binding protein [Eggerthellaceae bacterium]
IANQFEVMELLRRRVDDRNLAVAVVMHDINLALKYCDRFLILKDGSVYVYGNSDVVSKSMMREVYGVEADIVEHNGQKVVIA